MDTIACPHCQKPLSVEQILHGGMFSWPALSQIWAICDYCGVGGHFVVSHGEISTIRFIALGDWDVIDSLAVTGLSARGDPAFLHVWLGPEHYEYPARGT